jgi:hypothetical protein
MAVVRHKEAIHSGHFMVSSFEAEAQDDEENIAVPVPEEAGRAQRVAADTEEKRGSPRFTCVHQLFLHGTRPSQSSPLQVHVELPERQRCVALQQHHRHQSDQALPGGS